MNALDTRKAIQALLGTTVDGILGPQSTTLFRALAAAPDNSPWPPLPDPTVHTVMGSSFADPKDVAIYQQCKANGGSEEHCLSIGDNGIGYWSDDTKEGSGPSVALPPEIWEPWGAAAHLRPIVVINPANGKRVTALLKDTLPHGSTRIDMNPDTCAALRLTPPVLTTVQWKIAS